MFTISFVTQAQTNTATVEKRGHARVVQEALKTAGIACTVVVNKTVDLTLKPATPAQLKARADAKAKREAVAKKTATGKK